MHAIERLKSAKEDVTHNYEHLSSDTLSVLLLLAAAVIILIALFVRNPFIKAAALAYVTLP